jgi:hypothetical protein
MLSIENFSGLLTAIVRENLESVDYERIVKCSGLWIKPEADNFWVDTTLDIPHLQILYVANCRQRILDMVSLDSLKNLEKLLVVNTENGMKDFQTLGKSHKLKAIMIRRQKLTSESVEWIAQQSKISSIALTDVDASDMTISQLQCREQLKRLDLFRTDVTFTHSELFSGPFSKVKYLDISGTNVSGLSVSIIKELFPSLEELNLEDTQLSFSHLQDIAAWEGLLRLNSNTPELDFDRRQNGFWD